MNNLTRKQTWIRCSVILFLLNGCINSNQIKKPTKSNTYCLDSSFKAKIETKVPLMQDVVQIIPLTGVVETNPDKVIHFVSLVDGIISNTYFSLGDKVVKGQVLAELKSSQLLELATQSKILEAQIMVAEKKLQSVQSMFDDGVASQKYLMEAQSELTILLAQREKVNANLNLFSASQEKGVFLIKSPATGIVTEKAVAAGQQISADGEPLFTISDLSQVWVLANVYATNVKNIQLEMNVKIKTVSYPDEIFTGKIAAISNVLDPNVKVMKARVVLQNNDLKLKPGMLVDVNLFKELDKEALSIPTSAVIFDKNQNFVVVYHSDCDMEVRQIEILIKSNGTTFLSNGLNENEKIVTKNHLLVYEQIKNFSN